MLTVERIQKVFQSGGSPVRAVNDVSFSLDSGTFAAIVGKSGSGKSTLLALLGALDRPTSGSIKVDDVDITKLSDRKLTAYRRQDIGFVFQQYNLVPNLTAIENVMLPMEFAGVGSAKRRARAQELLQQVGLEGAKQQRKPARLSGGEQQRVAIARALANKPKLILADEPTGNLDTQTGEQVFSLLHELARTQEVTIIVVTHDLSIAGKCDVVLTIKDGVLTKTV
jgi:putative ABC transport system ATP-binding protein